MTTSARNQFGVAMGGEGLACFVCDANVVGRYYTLATCRTQSTKVRLIEKLGQLVGDQYMVVISEDDIICRGCANMMNTMDRLEKEMGSLRTVVLRYLEKKYDLKEGELVNNKATLPPPKQQVAVGTKKSANASAAETRNKNSLTDCESEDLSNGPSEKGSQKDPKSNVWMQCDKCKYTTPYNIFMTHHLRKHSLPKEQENPEEPKTIALDEVNEGDQKEGEDTSDGTNHNNETEPIEPLLKRQKLDVEESSGLVVHKESSMSGESETVEMIAAEINDLSQDQVVISEVQNVNVKVGVPVAENGEENQEGEHVSTLQVGEEDNGTLDTSNAICMVDENGMILQKMEQAEDGTLYVQVMEGGDPTKQVLSVAEDGSVQMVEVMWDDMVAHTAGEDDNMPF